MTLKFELMKRTSLVITILLSLLISNFLFAEKENRGDKFTIKRGTNVAHWLSQSTRRGADRENFIGKDDIRSIARMGFDHIRLPIDEEQMWDEQSRRHDDAFRLMGNCLEWCREYRLKVVIDLHILRSHHFNAAVKPLWTDPAEQEKFCNLWKDLSSYLKGYPNSMVAYELMNEAVADDPEQWNQLIAKAVSVIRTIEPHRTLVVGSNRWQSYSTFSQLKVPEKDSHIMLSFHFYEPFLLTHYHASWTYLRNYQGPVNYPGIILTEAEFSGLPDEVKSEVRKWTGSEFSKKVIGEMFSMPLEKARELKLALYCGEFGVMSGAPSADRLRWYSDLHALFSENGIAYANWNYKSKDFGLVDGKETKNEDLIRILGGN